MTTRADAHRPEFHREQAWKHPCRVAATGNVTIATGLLPGQVIDGVTLVLGNRVLLPAQSTGSQNGIWVSGPLPYRDYDMDTGTEAMGSITYVISGTVNGGTLWKNTNTSLPTIDTTALTFTQVTTGSSLTIKDEGTPLATAATSIDFTGAGVTASGTGAAKTVNIPGGATALSGLSDVTITSPAIRDRLRFDGTVWRNSALIWAPVMVLDPGTGNYLVLTDTSGNAIMAEV